MQFAKMIFTLQQNSSFSLEDSTNQVLASGTGHRKVHAETRHWDQNTGRYQPH